MALVAIHAVVDIPTHIGVMEVGSVVVAVATSALEDRVVVRIRMAGRANSISVAVIHVEPCVIEDRARPGGRRMARGTGRGEAGRLMVRIRRAVVVGLVASHARGWQRRVVVVDVAHHACDC